MNDKEIKKEIEEIKSEIKKLRKLLKDEEDIMRLNSLWERIKIIEKSFRKRKVFA